MNVSVPVSTNQSKWTNTEPRKTTTLSLVDRKAMDAALERWGQSLVSISRAKMEGKDYVQVAKDAIAQNYHYEQGTVLFKPTLAQENAFRITAEGALSYFVGGNPKYVEDRGFALNPWVKVDFDLAGVIEGPEQGIVMGNKFLKNAKGEVTIANFTMGFTRDKEGKLKINLHHSSLPFKA